MIKLVKIVDDDLLEFDLIAFGLEHLVSQLDKLKTEAEFIWEAHGGRPYGQDEDLFLCGFKEYYSDSSGTIRRYGGAGWTKHCFASYKLKPDDIKVQTVTYQGKSYDMGQAIDRVRELQNKNPDRTYKILKSTHGGQARIAWFRD